MQPPEPGLTPTKLALRRTVRDARANRPDDARTAAARALAMVALELPALRAARCVALYSSRPEEPGTGPLRAALRGRGVRVLLPVVVGDDDLDWAEDDGGETTTGPFGVAEPVGPRLGAGALAAADVVITPAVAVDTAGTRLGNGRGYYDRALRVVGPHALLIALVHDDELLDAQSTPIPRADHDVAVHAAITPTRWVHLSSPEAPQP